MSMQRIRVEIVANNSPGFLPTCVDNNQTEACDVGEVSEGIAAASVDVEDVSHHCGQDGVWPKDAVWYPITQ